MRVVVAMVAILAVGGAGCGRPKKNGNSTALANKTDFVYALSNDPPSLDPGTVQDVDAMSLLQEVYEGLVAYDAKNEIVPILASKWSVSPDGKTYTFTLRDAKFHDGKPVTADAFVKTFERNLHPKLASPTALGYLSDIVGATAYNEGKAPKIEGLRAIDAKTLEIRIDQPRAYFLGKLTYPCAFVIGGALRPEPLNAKEEGIGTGPFRYATIARGREVILDRFDGYHGGPAKIARIVRPIIKDPSTRFSKYRAGGLDYMGLERGDVPAAEKDAKLKGEIVKANRPAIYFYALNAAKYPPFKDERVRRAFAMGIDRKRIADDIMNQPFAKGLLPPGLPGYRESLAGIPYDVPAARKLLAEAGYPGGKGLPPVTLSYRAGRPDAQRLAAAAVTDLKSNLGVDASGAALEWAALLSARREGKLQMVVGSWFADYLDPQNFLSLLFDSASSSNPEKYSDPVADKLMRQADVERDAAKRIALYQQAEDRLLEKVARIPIYFTQDVILVKPYVKELDMNLMGVMPSRRVRMAP